MPNFQSLSNTHRRAISVMGVLAVNGLAVWIGWLLLQDYVLKTLADPRTPYAMETAGIGGFLFSTVGIVILLIGDGVIINYLTRDAKWVMAWTFLAVMVGGLWFQMLGPMIINNLVIQNAHLCQYHC